MRWLQSPTYSSRPPPGRESGGTGASAHGTAGQGLVPSDDGMQVVPPVLGSGAQPHSHCAHVPAFAPAMAS